jgi:thymidylate synthase ThyX
MGISKYGMISRLVWDGGDAVRIPEELGEPAPNQMLGTPAERLSEVGGRTCYDSLGRGRSSDDYHKHILEVGHGSVYEHFAMTVQISGHSELLWALINRPGVWVEADFGKIRVTFNPRAILDWNSWTKQLTYLSDRPDLVGKPRSVGDRLAYWAELAFPKIVPPRERSQSVLTDYRSDCRVEPLTEQEKWISMFMCGSRGWSHEQVRHKFRTAVSQRSTRFVNEAESPWVDHPLVQEYMGDPALVPADLDEMNRVLKAIKKNSRETYGYVVDRLEPWLIRRGVEKITARKQARGAARGYLGNALWTEMVFSASVAEWKWMMKLRCSSPADAEIRGIFCEALPELRSSRYGEDFKNLELVPAPDGLGQMAVERSSVQV